MYMLSRSHERNVRSLAQWSRASETSILNSRGVKKGGIVKIRPELNGHQLQETLRQGAYRSHTHILQQREYYKDPTHEGWHCAILPLRILARQPSCRRFLSCCLLSSRPSFVARSRVEDVNFRRMKIVKLVEIWICGPTI